MVYKGYAVDNRERFCEFDGNKLHYVLPFRGHRASLVYYVCAEYAKASPYDRMQLGDFGFNFLGRRCFNFL